VRWQEIGELPCPVARTLGVVGDRWTLLILRDCFLGAHRFDEFEASLGLSPHLLSTRLGKLVEHDILERRPYRERPTRHAYRLTEKGRDLYPVIASLLRWGDRWMSGDSIDVRDMKAQLHAPRNAGSLSPARQGDST
jgi:DNA-binding HxlR family transcriptional regulator